MSQYYTVLKKLAASNANERMPCTGIDKIQQWYSIVLDSSYKEIRIFVKDLSFLNNLFLLGLFNKFLNNPWSNVKILLKEDCDLSWFHQKNDNGNLEIRVATGSYSTLEAKEFTVVDDYCFRFELKPDFGIVNFNHYDDSINLVYSFDRAFVLGHVKNFKKVENNNE